MLRRAKKRGRRKAVVLLSGGLDSATVLYWALARGYACTALVVDYGQRHRREIRAARAIARAAGVPIRLVRMTLPWGGSALTDRQRALPKNRSFKRIGQGIPATYVPARNTLFLSLALGLAETIGAERILIGANAIDFSGYPDCRPAYITAFQKAARLGTKAGVEGKGVRIEAPLIRKSKAQIIRLGLKLGVPYEKSWSCYQGGSRPCGRCDSCLLREKGFSEAGF
ncbi:MAG: 7-cyano-7-deazaguanine synthase QueC [Candidatus Omnitrophica bacterium CG11_big_fil_rev_8_21_14_0_20_64_10]|nr:MAG: 7-cyano-7-deazaguanine synthase QueC [Candidatus Omnitrophica bacterium CG11_big_fil_rev_8_21_14_0_20_64_10]